MRLFRSRIHLETIKDINRFVAIVSQVPGKVELTDDEGHCVNAKSILGVMYSLEFNEIYCYSDNDISGKILSFIVE